MVILVGKEELGWERGIPLPKENSVGKGEFCCQRRIMLAKGILRGERIFRS